MAKKSASDNAKKFPGRKQVKNPDKSISTERTVTVGSKDKGFRNIPTMFKGKQVSPEKAQKIMKETKYIDPETGRTSRKFKSAKSAVLSAKVRSNALGAVLAAKKGKKKMTDKKFEDVLKQKYPNTKSVKNVTGRTASSDRVAKAGNNVQELMVEKRRLRKEDSPAATMKRIEKQLNAAIKKEQELRKTMKSK